MATRSLQTRSGSHPDVRRRTRRPRKFTGILLIPVALAALDNPSSWSNQRPATVQAGNLVNLPSGAVSILAPPNEWSGPGGAAGEAAGGSTETQGRQAQEPSKANSSTGAVLRSNRKPLLPPASNGRVTGSAARLSYLRNYGFSTGNSYKDPGRNNNTPGAVRNGYIGQSGDTYGTSGNPLYVGPPGG